MARLNTKADLVDYIQGMLGGDVITVDVPEARIEQIIDDCIQKFTEYAYGTLEATVIVQLNGAGEYDMPELMTNLIKLSKGGTTNITNFGANYGGFVPNLWSEQYFSSSNSLTGTIVPTIMQISSTSSMLEKFFGDDINYNFNPYKKVLQVLENYTGAAVLHYEYEYIADDDGDLIFNHEWIKQYAVSKTKFLWGTITGKFDRELIGGARINYADMKSEAQQEIELLDQQLLDRWSDPAPIDIA